MQFHTLVFLDIWHKDGILMACVNSLPNFPTIRFETEIINVLYIDESPPLLDLVTRYVKCKYFKITVNIYGEMISDVNRIIKLFKDIYPENASTDEFIPTKYLYSSKKLSASTYHFHVHGNVLMLHIDDMNIPILVDVNGYGFDNIPHEINLNQTKISRTYHKKNKTYLGDTFAETIKNFRDHIPGYRKPILHFNQTLEYDQFDWSSFLSSIVIATNFHPTFTTLLTTQL